MSTVTGNTPSGARSEPDPALAETGSPRPSAGRTRVSARALSSVAAAVTAEALGVGAGSVKVDLSDESGNLVLAVSSPIRLPDLDRVRSDSQVVPRSGGTLLERAARAQDIIRGRTTELTGSQVARVAVRITGTEIRREVRVR